MPESYRPIETLSEGGDTHTYRAQATNGQEVVVKQLQIGRLQNWKRMQLFEREARILAHISHPRIPQFLDFFWQEGPQGMQAYLVTEWIPGETLAQKIHQHWLCSETEAIHFAEQVLQTLIYLHAYSPPVIHRDIKPANLILRPDNALSIIDFGGVQEFLHPVGGGGSTVIGTLGYMAPEQFSGRAVPSSDLYGLGTTLIHCLTGRTPAQIPQKDMQLMFQSFIQASGGFSRWLTRLIRPAIEDRFPNAQAALSQLYEMTGAHPIAAPTPEAQTNQQILTLEMTVNKPFTEKNQYLPSGYQLGAYRIEDCLSQGSHTVTYSAHDNQGQALIIKELYLGKVQDWKALELFQREIDVLLKLNHRGIPKYLDHFEQEIDDELRYYLTMEQIKAPNLEEIQATGWRPTEPEVLHFVQQALEILIYLGNQTPPVVHRDIKPSNFLRDENGQVYLIDFGGVQNRFPQGGGSTVIGTYGYIAPEEFLKKAVPATDLFSLGCTLIRLLSGREPTELPQKDMKLQFRKYVQVSEPLKAWIEHLIEPNLSQRYRSALQAQSFLPKPPLVAPPDFQSKDILLQAHKFLASQIQPWSNQLQQLKPVDEAAVLTLVQPNNIIDKLKTLEREYEKVISLPKSYPILGEVLNLLVYGGLTLSLLALVSNKFFLTFLVITIQITGIFVFLGSIFWLWLLYVVFFKRDHHLGDAWLNLLVSKRVKQRWGTVFDLSHLKHLKKPVQLHYHAGIRHLSIQDVIFYHREEIQSIELLPSFQTATDDEPWLILCMYPPQIVGSNSYLDAFKEIDQYEIPKRTLVFPNRAQAEFCLSIIQTHCQVDAVIFPEKNPA